MKTDLFQSHCHCWVFQICWHIECSTFTASSFRIWNSSTGIPSPPLALFAVMLPKAHLTSHSRMSGSRWVITPSWLTGSWRSILYSSSVHSCPLFLISYAFVMSIPFLSFIESIFAWNIPLVQCCKVISLQLIKINKKIKRMWYTYTCMQLINKKNEIMPLAATCMDLEMIILTEVSQRKANTIWYLLHVESKKDDTNELIDNTERLTNTENKCLVTKRERAGGRERGDVEFRINKYILLYKSR